MHMIVQQHRHTAATIGWSSWNIIKHSITINTEQLLQHHANNYYNIQVEALDGAAETPWNLVLQQQRIQQLDWSIGWRSRNTMDVVVQQHWINITITNTIVQIKLLEGATETPWTTPPKSCCNNTKQTSTICKLKQLKQHLKTQDYNKRLKPNATSRENYCNNDETWT
jgi:hypothetical protein